jgi:hypothetical protein
MFAHASLALSPHSVYRELAADLKKRAVRAWTWFHQHPLRTDCDTQEIKAGDADQNEQTQKSQAVAAAIYLFALTGDETYHEYVRLHLTDGLPFRDEHWGVYGPEHGDALLFYARLPAADRDVVTRIRERKLARASDVRLYGLQYDKSLYRAWVPDRTYHWGSLAIIANYGSSALDFLVQDWDPANHARYRERALCLLHYFHGINPMGLVYLSNAGSLGAEQSLSRIYHSWFSPGSRWETNPPPAYVPGGPNRTYNGSIKAIRDQPSQKAYLDFNDGYPQASWEITENGIYYQAAYIKLLSYFCP